MIQRRHGMNTQACGRNILDKIKEECGVFGIWNHPEAAHLTYLGLYAIQHRGQEAAGIVSLKNGEHRYYKGLGLVADVFTSTHLDKLQGHGAIGHVRYSTRGGNKLSNAQPLTAELRQGPIALAHNGNIVNIEKVKEELQQNGAIFHGSNDTEVFLHLLAHSKELDLIKAMSTYFKKLEGAFSFVALNQNKLIAVRDRRGFRPLCIGRLKNPDGGMSYVLSSETCSFDLIGAKYYRDVKPGEIFWVDEEGEHSLMFHEPEKTLSQCVFEYVYFARPDSFVFGKSAYEVRKNFGKQLAKQSSHLLADVVIPVPDSGVPAAIGYASESGLPFELGIIRNHYVGRTFIEPHQSIRSFGVKIKLNPQKSILEGKRVIIVDDSLVRGTTSKKIVDLVRQAGAKEVHLGIAAPPIVGSCYYGVDTPSRNELIASQKDLSDIREFIGVDTLTYLSMEGLWEAVGEQKRFCSACFDGKYPTAIP